MNVHDTRMVFLTMLPGSEPRQIHYRQALGTARPIVIIAGAPEQCPSIVTAAILAACRDRAWHCVLPHPVDTGDDNDTAGEADLLIAAARWSIANLHGDPRRLFILGWGPGGGMALGAVALAPSLWTAASVWSPFIPPAENPSSPCSALWRAHIVPIDLNAGSADARGGPAPLGHAVRAFNDLVRAAGRHEDRIGEDIVGFVEDEEALPRWYEGLDVHDDNYPVPLLLRRTSGLTRFTLYEGAGEFFPEAAFDWFDSF